MTKQERWKKLLRHLGILLLGLGLCTLIGWLLYLWELAQPIVYQSDLNFDFRGLASILIGLLLGLIFLIVWTTTLAISSWKHRKDRTYFWLNNLIAALPYLIMLAIFGYNRIHFILREKRQNDFVKTPQLTAVPFHSRGSIIAAYTQKDTIYFLTGVKVNIPLGIKPDTLPAVQIVMSRPVFEPLSPNNPFIEGVLYMGMDIEKKSLRMFRLYNKQQIAPGNVSFLIDSVFYARIGSGKAISTSPYYRIKDNYDSKHLIKGQPGKENGITLYNKEENSYNFPFLYDFSCFAKYNPLGLPNWVPFFKNAAQQKLTFVEKTMLNGQLDTGAGSRFCYLAVFSPNKVIVYKIPRINKLRPLAVSIIDDRCYLFYQKRILYFLLD